jgi:hypothetical protein
LQFYRLTTVQSAPWLVFSELPSVLLPGSLAVSFRLL